MGAVNVIVPFEELENKAMQLASRAAKIPAESMTMLKHAIRKVHDIDDHSFQTISAPGLCHRRS